MKFTVLVDNNTYLSHDCYGEPGASFFIETDDKKILFDTGYSDICITNAEKLGIDLREIDSIVLSHGHDDHSGGLKFLDEYMDLSNVKLIAHPSAFYPKIAKGEICGTPFNLDEIKTKTKFNPSREPYKICENGMYLGEIPDYNDFEKRSIKGIYEVNGKWLDDYLLDDSAVCFRTSRGLFVITGCSHSGICNIVEHAKNVFNENKVFGVVGGFHIFDKDERLEKTIDYFEKNNVKIVYPSHCTSLKVKAEILKKFDFEEIGVGFKLEIN